MNYEKMGIYVSIIVLIAVLGVAAVSSGNFDIGVGEFKIPNITSSTDTSRNGFYDYCYKMGFDC